MFGFGGISEIAFILFLALLIFGPEKLPEIGRMLAKGMAEVRKASNELRRTLNVELAASEQQAEARRLAAQPAAAPPMPLAPVAPVAPVAPLAPVAQAVPSAYPYSYALPPAEAPEPSTAAAEPPDPWTGAAAFQVGAGADAPAAPAAPEPPAVVAAPQATPATPAPPAPPAVAAAPPVTVLEPYGQGGGPHGEPVEIEAPR
jgi:TatA/E family protein of Tat protein translocase